MSLSQQELTERARHIRLLLTDCDGVLTDGSLPFFSDGTRVYEETKVFHIHDGLGFRLARLGGLKTGIISGRSSLALATRAQEMEVNHLYQGVEQKLDAYRRIRSLEGLSDAEIAYIGDDLPDLPILRRVGLGIAVANAVREVREFAHLIAEKRGGHGAVREVIELILDAQGKLSKLIPSL